ncbi:MAG: hypothetical protein AAB946_00285, partial [Patescibacteria group bacterium]
SERRTEILGHVVSQMETAGHGGFSVMIYFGQPTGIFDPMRGRPVGLRRNLSVTRFTGETGVSESELKEFKGTLIVEEGDAITAAASMWREKMNKFWQRRTEEMNAEAATA